MSTDLRYNGKNPAAIFLNLSVIFPPVLFDEDKEVKGQPTITIVMESSYLSVDTALRIVTGRIIVPPLFTEVYVALFHE